ncbi:hypothetical protein [Ovoidimarina sediminis]|uniref:hypothetical protein n=1 Tax=Ovoidimarina sediminis TaxID=3079856 RepID=UPI0029073678|nr:hypothetical protein [Rhodophyticola sp. MJ-SS7]MDU8946566.1 hypothetical protein [Rhodophyticola sp. MJ-SS7]
MRRDPEPLFLARETYRRRRMMDAARILPFLGVFLFLVPAIWGGAVSTLSGLIYLFIGWAVLIVLSAVIARVLARPGPQGDRVDDEVGG